MSNVRKVTVYSTKGQKRTELNTSATTWGELRQEVVSAGYDMDSLTALENVNRTTLEHSGATLPSGEFTLFLKPQKTKSGAYYEDLSFSELRNVMLNSTGCKDYMENKYGKNWTRLSTEELVDGLSAWEYDGGEVEEDDTSSTGDQEAIKLIKKAKEALQDVCDYMDDDEEACDRVEIIQDELDALMEMAGGTSETRKLDQEAQELFSGLDD